MIQRLTAALACVAFTFALFSVTGCTETKKTESKTEVKKTDTKDGKTDTKTETKTDTKMEKKDK
jgi:hypothetical protein